jgi:hypothetical protein
LPTLPYPEGIYWPDEYADREENPHPLMGGTFIQTWYCASWDEARWDIELQAMVDLGMDILVIQEPTSYENGVWSVHHTPAIPELADARIVNPDFIGTALRKCQEYGVKVFLGMGMQPEAQHFAGWVSDQFREFLHTVNKIVTDIYEQYKHKYPETLYGWYWVPELYNSPHFSTVRADRNDNIRAMADSFNITLDHLTELDPSMPFMISPYASILLSNATGLYAMWRDLLRTANFRPGDILIPQDGLGAGGGGITLEIYVPWKKAYRKAVDDSESGVVLWANNETFDGKDWSSFTFDHFIRQMQIASAYADKLVNFAYIHYYGPINNHPAFYNTYKDYVLNGRLESEPPGIPHFTETEVEELDDGRFYVELAWEIPQDNFGVVRFLIYKDGEEVRRYNVGAGGNFNLQRRFAEYLNSLDTAIVYEVVAVDAAGNLSPPSSVVIGGEHWQP